MKGLVPVCSSCKSIRNDQGFWTKAEKYLSEHTELKISHGICDKYLMKEFPDVYKEMI